MYNFIFVFFFRLAKKNPRLDANDYAANFVSLAICSQIFLIGSAINFFMQKNMVAVFMPEKNYNKYMWLILILPIMFFVAKFYKKNGDEIINKYENEKIITIRNTFLLIILLISPWLGLIGFLNYF